MPSNPGASDPMGSKMSDKRVPNAGNNNDLMRRMTPLHMISRPSGQQNAYGGREGPGAGAEAQAQSAYMDRQKDKVIDKIMEMEPKSVPQPTGLKMERDELDGGAYPRGRSRGRDDLNDGYNRADRGENPDLADPGGYMDDQ